MEFFSIFVPVTKAPVAPAPVTTTIKVTTQLNAENEKFRIVPSSLDGYCFIYAKKGGGESLMVPIADIPSLRTILKAYTNTPLGANVTQTYVSEG